MSLYRCDGCTEPIPPNKVRMHCQQCPDYDLCADCVVLGAVTGSHHGSRATTLDSLTGPDKAHADLNRLLHHYRPRIFLERGDVPRRVLPAAAVPEMVARLAAAQAGGEAAVRAQQASLTTAGARSADGSRMVMNTVGLDYDYTRHTGYYYYQG